MNIFKAKRDRAGRKKAGIWTQAVNYFKATQKARDYERENGEAPLLPDKEIAERIDRCSQCDYLVESDTSCSDCGCPIFDKVELSTEYCPFGKWPEDPATCEECKRVDCSC